ncbi:MAG: stage V sporulation protein SpoVM [Clostridia bacterium]|nr:stage V sporulation protein SpoVM [Clostridia bacterium]
MKVVVVKSPKFLRGILRMIFGIKKETDCE